MKAVIMTSTGGPEVLRLKKVEDPRVTGARDLLVRLKAAGVNPVDTKLRAKGTYFPDRTPTILGCDGAGIVEQVGERVERFKAGDAVFFCHGGIGGPSGNYAEYAVVDERFAAPKPASLDFVPAAAAPLVLITAWESLHDRGRIQAGNKVLIHAGAGGVGHVAVQLAKAAGAHVCTTVGSRQKANLVRELGADNVVLYKETDFVQAALDWTGGTGIDLVLDTVGGATLQRSAEAIRVYGDLVTLLQPGPEMDWKVARLRNLRISLELMLAPMYFGLQDAQQHQASILEQCGRLFDEGRLQIHVERTFPLDQAAEAHRLLEEGSMSGKLVLTMD
jgi:NADPH2:quinone reductase